MKDNFYFTKANLIFLVIALSIITIGYIIMGSHRTSKIVESDIKSLELFKSDIQNANQIYNFKFINNLNGEKKDLDKLNQLITSDKFLSKKILAKVEIPEFAKVILERINAKKNPDKIKTQYSDSNYLKFYNLLNKKEKTVVNRYMIESILPNSFKLYINDTGDNTLSVILIILGYVILIPLAIMYRKRK